jgi:pimeloyl-ACP methyl ester carboxylesterase
MAKRADLARYTTSIAAGDYRQVIDALGYARINIIGGSYGTRLGLELARQMPGRIRTLTLEGIVPPDFGWPTTGARDAEDALNAIVSDCKADRECARAFPALEKDIDRAFASLARPVMVTVRDPASGTVEKVPFAATDLAYAMRGVLYGPEALSLPHWFRDAAAGSFERFAQAYVNRARNLDRQIADGVHFGTYCAEDLPRVDWTAARAAAAGTRTGTYLIDQYRAVCDVWPRATVPASFFEPLRSPVPTLMMSGRRDPVTPPRTAAALARTLPISRLLIWKYGGHGSDGIADRDCRPRIIGAFIASTSPANLPIECMDGPPLPFHVR